MSQASRTGDRTAWSAPLGVGASAFALYLATLSPAIYWKDSSEFVTVAHGLDIAHPAGSPAYAPVAKLFDLLPVADIAVRVNLASAASAAVAVALLYVLATEVLAACRVPTLRARWVALGATALFALAPAWWLLASTAEVYPLQNAFLLAVLAMLARWHRTREGTDGTGDLRWLAAAAFLYGVSAGAHAAVAFFVPGLVLFGLSTLGMRLARPRILGTLVAAFALGLSVYLYLPIRSIAGDLAYDWGNPETPARFVDHVLDRKDAGVIASLSVPKLPRQAAMFAGFARDQITALGAVLALVGLVSLARRATPLALLTAGAFAGYVGFFIRYWDTPYGYIPGFWLLALWAAAGLAAALDFLARRLPRLRPGWVGAAFAGIVAFHGVTAWAHADKSDYRATESLARATFVGLPEGALVFAVVQWFQAVYLQEIEGRRPDLQILATSELKAPQWFRSVDAERFPDLRLPDVPLAAETFSRYMPALIAANIGERRAFLEVDQDTFTPLEKNLVPRGFLFEVLPDMEMERRGRDFTAYFDDLRAFLAREFEHPGFFDDRGAAQMYTRAATGYGVYFLHRGAPRAALAMFELSRLIEPTLTDAVAYAGLAHQALGEWERAEARLRESVALTPHRRFPRASLGFLLAERDGADEARSIFEGLLAEQATDDRALFGLGLLAMRAGRTGEAEAYFASAARAAPASAFGRRAREILGDLQGKQASPPTPANGANHVSG